MSRPSFAHPKSCWRGRTMWTDMIVEEARQAREAHAAQFNYDLAAIYRDLKAKEQESARAGVSFPPKQPVTFTIRKGVEANAAYPVVARDRLYIELSSGSF